jgi:hypothetical protein
MFGSHCQLAIAWPRPAAAAMNAARSDRAHVPNAPSGWGRQPILLAALMWAVVGAAGCDPRMAMFFLQPFDPKIDPLGPDLKGKTVVVLPHASLSTLGDSPTIDRDLARELSVLLRDQGKRITVIPTTKVNTWLESHPDWTDPAQIGRDLKADAVILIEIDQFQYQDPSSPGMLHGNARIHLQVTELAPPAKGEEEDAIDGKISRVIYDEHVATTFPERGPVPADSRVTPMAFRSKFLKQVAQELSWHFVRHEAGDRIQDTRFN